MLSNSLKMNKIDRNMSELRQIVCKIYNFNIRTSRSFNCVNSFLCTDLNIVKKVVFCWNNLNTNHASCAQTLCQISAIKAKIRLHFIASNFRLHILSCNFHE